MEISRNIRLKRFKGALKNTSTSVNLISTIVDGNVVRDVNDDIAPLRIESDTVGGNHGYIVSEVKDIENGEYFDENMNKWVVGEFESFKYCAREDGKKESSPSKLFQDGNEVIPTIIGNGQLQSYKVKEIKKVFIDGVEVKECKESEYKKSIEVTEYYGVKTRSSTVLNTSEEVCFVSNKYVIEDVSTLLIETKVDFLKDTYTTGTEANFMFMQAQKSNSVQYIVPKMKDKTVGGITYSLSSLTDIDSLKSTVNCTPSDFSDDVWFADRVITKSKDGVFTAIGVLPYYDALPEIRRINAHRKGLSIRGGTFKIYFEVLSLGDFVKSGETFHAVGYRSIAELKDGFLSWSVPYKGAVYRYIHFLANAEVELPKGTVIDSYKVSINLGRVRGSEGSCLVVMSK